MEGITKDKRCPTEQSLIWWNRYQFWFRLIFRCNQNIIQIPHRTCASFAYYNLFVDKFMPIACVAHLMSWHFISEINSHTIRLPKMEGIRSTTDDHLLHSRRGFFRTNPAKLKFPSSIILFEISWIGLCELNKHFKCCLKDHYEKKTEPKHQFAILKCIFAFSFISVTKHRCNLTLNKHKKQQTWNHSNFGSGGEKKEPFSTHWCREWKNKKKNFQFSTLFSFKIFSPRTSSHFHASPSSSPSPSIRIRWISNVSAKTFFLLFLLTFCYHFDGIHSQDTKTDIKRIVFVEAVNV